MRQEVTHLIHQMNRRFAVLDADVHVQAENQVRARDELHVFDDLQIALVRIDVLHAPVGERMRGAGRQQQAVLAREPNHLAPQIDDVLARFLDVAADAGADLDHRLVHLGLDLLVQQPLAVRDQLGADVRAQIECRGIDRLVFLFDAEREGRCVNACPQRRSEAVCQR